MEFQEFLDGYNNEVNNFIKLPLLPEPLVTSKVENPVHSIVHVVTFPSTFNFWNSLIDFTSIQTCVVSYENVPSISEPCDPSHYRTARVSYDTNSHIPTLHIMHHLFHLFVLFRGDTSLLQGKICNAILQITEILRITMMSRRHHSVILLLGPAWSRLAR